MALNRMQLNRTETSASTRLDTYLLHRALHNIHVMKCMLAHRHPYASAQRRKTTSNGLETIAAAPSCLV